MHLFDQHGEQDYAILNQHWVYKFEEMGWDLFLRKNRGITVLCRLNLWGATLLKMGLRGMLVCFFVKREP